MAKLIGIAIRPARSGEINELDNVEISKKEGVAGDKRSRPGKRQVTLMSKSAWDIACRELDIDLPWTVRRANLLVDDLPLKETTGQFIHCGELVLEITGETDPCKLMESAQPGLFKALIPDWRGGVTCRVLQGGRLTIGMDASLSKTAQT